MYKTLLGLACLLVLPMTLVFAKDDYKPGPDSMEQPGVPQGELVKFVWKSDIYPNTVRDVWVYVPAQYNAKDPACVMVFQDGPRFYADRKAQFRVPTVLDNFIHKKEIPVMIAIFIDPGSYDLTGGKNGSPDFKNRSFEYDTLSDQYARFLDKEILPEVGKKYNLRQDAAGRAIGGISSGGICAFTVAWERPDLFSKVLSHVGSFTNIRGGDRYPGIIRKVPNKPIRVFLQDGSGDLDNASGNWWLGNLQMEATLKFKKYDYKTVWGDGGHNGKHGGAILPDSLRWLWRTSSSTKSTPANWPQFRGPGANGIAEGSRLPDRWDTIKNVAWQTKIPGRGWSSPIVWDDKVFVTAVLNDNTTTPRPGLYIQDLQGKIPPGEHRWMVYCLDLKSGKIVWEHGAHTGEPSTPIHLKNTYASETPVTDGERVYAYFGNLGLFCYDVAGKLLWSKKIGSHPMRIGWGTGASPVLHNDRLYITHDNEEQSFLIALDKRTGAQIWRVERDEKSNWSTPFVWANEKRTEIVTAGTGKVRSYDLDGKLLWEFKGMSSITIPTPFTRHGLLYVASGYILDGSRPLYAIRPGAEGDISLQQGETSNKHIVWCQRTAAAYHPSPLVFGDYLYVLNDKGFLACYDARTGAEVYGRQRIDGASDKFTSSPWANDGKVFCLSEDGETFVIRAGPKFEVLGKNALDEMSLSTPALAGDRLILRTASKVYCIRNQSN